MECCLLTNGRCPYEINNECTSICGGKKPYGEPLCHKENLEYKYKNEVSKEGLVSFIQDFVNVIKNKD